MSEEQLSEEEIQKRIQMMKENCIFCKMIKGEIDCKKIFEDDICIAILDINPATKGHLLLIPKEHYMMMPMIPDETMGHLGIISKMLADLLKKTFDTTEVSIFIANGAAAGQQSQHFMMHVIPRYENDGLNFNLEGEKLSTDKLKDLTNQIKTKLSSKQN